MELNWKLQIWTSTKFRNIWILGSGFAHLKCQRQKHSDTRSIKNHYQNIAITSNFLSYQCVCVLLYCTYYIISQLPPFNGISPFDIYPEVISIGSDSDGTRKDLPPREVKEVEGNRIKAFFSADMICF